ncbi:MAG: dedA [Clostridiaceae bacterium]|nr:dedA [Clostridiaceae bacterium]
MKLIDFILHLDKYLSMIITAYGTWTYALLFMIVFLETGLVITPFLPGDSIIFASGAFAAIGSMNLFSLYILFLAAAILGDTANYTIGKKIGIKAFEKDIKFLNKEYLNKAHSFYEKHGAITIVIARFIPIIRTFAPFVAGIGEMHYTKFISYNMVGGIAWVSLFLFGGYYFGNFPFIQSHFTYVLVAIIFVSLIPAVVGIIKERKSTPDCEN